MHDQGSPRKKISQESRYQVMPSVKPWVLLAVLALHPAKPTVSELILKLGGDPENSRHQCEVNKAAFDLQTVGLVCRHEDKVWLTWAAQHFKRRAKGRRGRVHTKPIFGV